MAGRAIARVSWDLPNGEEHVHWMLDDEQLVFGRAAECQIQLGRVPYDDRVPTLWGRMTWGGRLRVENVAERTAKWSFSLHSTANPDTLYDEVYAVVTPGTETSLAHSQFEVRARAPGGLGIEYCIRVNAFRRPGPLPVTNEPPSVIEVALSDAEKAIGSALIAPLANGAGVGATYEAIAKETHYSKDGVRDAVERIDAKLAGAGLYRTSIAGRTPDRVARALLDQRSLLG